MGTATKQKSELVRELISANPSISTWPGPCSDNSPRAVDAMALCEKREVSGAACQAIASEAVGLLADAIHYASSGFAVFPIHGISKGRCTCGKSNCGSPGKHPRTIHGLYSATTYIEELDKIFRGLEYPATNIGIRTGQASSLIVVDVDIDKGAKLENLYELGIKDSLDETLQVRTGGGIHFYFWYEGAEIKNSASKIAPFIDVRGEGGYVVAPTSTHVSGRRYEFSKIAEVQAMPSALLDLLNKIDNFPQKGNLNGSTRLVGNEINNGTRNATLTSIGGSLRNRGCEWATIYAALAAENTQKCKPPLSDAEVRSIATSICKYPVGIAKSPGNEIPTISPRVLSLAELVAEHPQLRPSLIEGVLRVGEVGNLIAKAKVGKSWLVYHVALAVATGSKLFEQFNCRKGKVLIIDNELHKESIANRLPKVAADLGIRPEEYENQIDVISLRGGLLNIEQLAPILATFSPGHYQLVILDAFYRALPEGVSENGNAEIARVYNLVDRYAEMMQASFILIHHATKGSQADKDVVDVGSGASAQARAADAHIVLRPHQDAACIVMEAAVRSWAPLEAITLRWEYPTWRKDDNADPGALKGKKPQFEERQEQKDKVGMEEVLTALRKEPDTVKGLASRLNMGPARIQRLIGGLVQGYRVEYENTKKRGQECRIYRPLD